MATITLSGLSSRDAERFTLDFMIDRGDPILTVPVRSGTAGGMIVVSHPGITEEDEVALNDYVLARTNLKMRVRLQQKSRSQSS